MASLPVPVTLNCSGGIALGAYMAGVFSELVKASLRCRADGRAEVLRIDSITGASAGAMTGLIAARYLLQDPERSLAELDDDRVTDAAPRNGFLRAWVRLADIRALTDYRTEEQSLQATAWGTIPPRPRLALLSSGSIAAIADQVGGAWGLDDLAGMRQALQRRSLALLMTVTNLQGVLRVSDSGPRSVSHAETRRFLFHRAMPDLTADDLDALNRRWTKAKDSARASGAFPLAFPPPLERQQSPQHQPGSQSPQ
ncbi:MULTISPECIES: patatin-like phospholipase family protein [Aphanothece]|uniref:patatin-like phospholipase family protein n=1 Tax=Aphanothece TaxID=1121 RepID=UPI0039856569